MKQYETMYIIKSSLDDAARAALVEQMHGIITQHGGTIDNVDDWGMRDFAYEIDHMSKGYYVVVKPVVSLDDPLWPQLTLVHYPLDTCVSVEVGTFPAVCAIDITIGVEDICSAEWLRLREVIYRAYARGYDRECSNEQECRHTSPYVS